MKRRDLGRLFQLDRKGEIEVPLHLGQPTPAAVVEEQIPLVPETARVMPQADDAADLEVMPLVAALHAEFQRRVVLDRGSDRSARRARVA